MKHTQSIPRNPEGQRRIASYVFTCCCLENGVNPIYSKSLRTTASLSARRKAVYILTHRHHIPLEVIADALGCKFETAAAYLAQAERLFKNHSSTSKTLSLYETTL